ncbi:hypothetical protein JTS97_02175 [Clostridium botulinum]|nr:hypothetical protein [Clostridium botulinum]
MHLKQEIKDIRKNFDNVNISNYRFALSKITLREGITEEEAIEYFWIFKKCSMDILKAKHMKTASLMV